MKMLSLFLILSTLLFGCSSNATTSETSAIIWIMGGVSQDSHIFEIKDNGAIKLASGNVILDTETGEVFYGENVKTKLVTPGSNEISFIKTLLSEIEKKEGDKINSGNDTIEVFALINSRLYWTPFYDDEVKNKELLELTKFLLKTSSTKIE